MCSSWLFAPLIPYWRCAPSGEQSESERAIAGTLHRHHHIMWGDRRPAAHEVGGRERRHHPEHRPRGHGPLPARHRGDARHCSGDRPMCGQVVVADGAVLGCLGSYAGVALPPPPSACWDAHPPQRCPPIRPVVDCFCSNSDPTHQVDPPVGENAAWGYIQHPFRGENLLRVRSAVCLDQGVQVERWDAAPSAVGGGNQSWAAWFTSYLELLHSPAVKAFCCEWTLPPSLWLRAFRWLCPRADCLSSAVRGSLPQTLTGSGRAKVTTTVSTGTIGGTRALSSRVLWAHAGAARWTSRSGW